MPFSSEVLIEREDFMENAPSKFHRLEAGRRGAAALRLHREMRARREGRGGRRNRSALQLRPRDAQRLGRAGRKVKGTIHWVSAKHAFRAPVRLYDRLFMTAFPGGDLGKELNPDSLKVVQAALEPALAHAQAGDRFQFERNGYFVADSVLSKPGKPVFNRTVTLRDSWAKIEQEALAAADKTADAD